MRQDLASAGTVVLVPAIVPVQLLVPVLVGLLVQDTRLSVRQVNASPYLKQCTERCLGQCVVVQLYRVHDKCLLPATKTILPTCSFAPNSVCDM